jgi:pimeloyl-ACP methyl ester carboxylesterase
MFPGSVPGYRTGSLALRSGERVRVIETGFSRGRPVVFVHGWGCSAWSFNRAMPVVADAGFRAIAIDLRGHGLSDKPLGRGPYTTESMVAHLAATLDVLAVDRPVVVAHSMGAATAMHLALRDDRRLRALALLAPVGFGIAHAAGVARTLSPRWVVPLCRAGLRRRLVGRILGLTYGTLGTYDERDVDEYWAPAQFAGFIPALRELLHHFRWTPFTMEELLRVRTPTLIIRGEEDRVVRPLPDSLGRYAGAREVVIGGAGHLVHDEAAAEVNATLVRFLDVMWT